MKPSLVICSHGRPQHMAACLAHLDAEGLRAQSADVVLVTALDDTATADVMSGYAKKAPFRVEVVRTERRGLSAARNAGIAAAKGDLLLFTDDDCVVAPGYVGKVVAGMGAGDYGYGAGAVHWPGAHAPGTGHIGRAIVLQPNSLIPAGVVQGANMFFRRDVFDRIGGFREEMGAGTDFVGAEVLEMATRASLAGYAGTLLSDALITHEHGRAPGSEEAIQAARSHDLGHGAHYAYLMSNGVHEIWQFWAGTAAPDANRRVRRSTLERLQREFEGASKYLAYCLASEPKPPPKIG